MKQENTEPTTIPQLLNYKTLTLHYGLFQSTISKLVMNGKFCNVVKVGNKNYFKRSDVEKWIDSHTIEITSCTYDVLSIIYYARNINYDAYQVNDTIPVTVIMDNEVFNIYFRYKGKEKKKIKDFGTFDCIRFGVFLVEGDLFEEGEDMDVWVTDDKNKIPVLIESPILIGSVKARIVGIKGNRNPVTALRKSSSFF